jgi:hypothetical protein
VEGGQPSERSGAHGRGRSTFPRNRGGGPRRHRPVPWRAQKPHSQIIHCFAHERTIHGGGRGAGRERTRRRSTRSHPEPGRAHRQRRRSTGGATPRELRPSRAAPRPRRPPSPRPPPRSSCRGVEQRQLVGLITQRSWVRIPPPLPTSFDRQMRCHSWRRFCVLRKARVA